MVAKSAEPKVKNGLLSTPAMAKGLPKASLTDNARQVLMKRYVRRGDDGKPAENVEEMFWRVAITLRRSKNNGARTFRSARLSITIYYPAKSFSRTLLLLQARGLL